jgi:hypothetical protein
MGRKVVLPEASVDVLSSSPPPNSLTGGRYSGPEVDVVG